MYFWRAIYQHGTETACVDGILRYQKVEEAEAEAKMIINTIGIDEYARMKGIDLSVFQLDGVYIVTTLNN